MTTPMLGLRTVIHPVADLVGAKAWFTDLLGFGPYFDEPFYVGFEVAGYELGLLPVADSVRRRAHLLGRRRRRRRGGRRGGAGGATVHTAAAEVGDEHRDRDRHHTAGRDRRLHLQPALRRELTGSGGARCGRDELDGDAVGIAELQRRLAELEDDAGVVDPDLGEMVGPEPQRVAVGDREREMVEWFGRGVARPRIGPAASARRPRDWPVLQRDVAAVVGRR